MKDFKIFTAYVPLFSKKFLSCMLHPNLTGKKKKKEREREAQIKPLKQGEIFLRIIILEGTRLIAMLVRVLKKQPRLNQCTICYI